MNPCPMRFVFRARFDPTPEEFEFFSVQRFSVTRGGHHPVGVRGMNPFEKQAALRITGNDGGAATARSNRVFPQVQSKVSRSRAGIRPMTGKAPRQNRPDRPIE